MDWLMTYQKNGKRIFSKREHSREAAYNIAFEHIKILTESYCKQGVQYRYTHKDDEICVETDNEKHVFEIAFSKMKTYKAV